MIETEFGESLISLGGNNGATSSGAEMGYNGLGGKFHNRYRQNQMCLLRVNSAVVTTIVG